MKKVKMLICTMLVVLAFTSCHKAEPIENTSDNMQVINSYDYYLAYDPTTKIIYITNGYKLSPYISENGKYCKYIDGEIVEVD